MKLYFPPNASLPEIGETCEDSENRFKGKVVAIYQEVEKMVVEISE